MKLVIQRVLEANVTVEGKCVGSIGKGFMVLLGVGKDDTKEIADRYIDKLIKMRIFADENGKINRSLEQVEGEILVVSQLPYMQIVREVTARILYRRLLRYLPMSSTNMY